MMEKGFVGGNRCLETNSSASQTERELKPLGPVLSQCVSLLESSADFQELTYRVQHSCNGLKTLTITRDKMAGLLGGMLDPVSISLTSSGQCYLSVLFRPLQAIDLKPQETGDLDLAAFKDLLYKLNGQAGYGFCPGFQLRDFPQGLRWQSHGLQLLDSPCPRVQAQACPVFWQLRPPSACPEGRGLEVQLCSLCVRAVADLYVKLKSEGRDVSSPAFAQFLSSGGPPVHQSFRSVSSTEEINVERERSDISEHHSNDSNAIPLETQGKEETVLSSSSEGSGAPLTTATCERKNSDMTCNRGSSDGLNIHQELAQDKMDEERVVDDRENLGSKVSGKSSTCTPILSTRTPASADKAATAGITAASSTSLLPKEEELHPSPLPAHTRPSGAMGSNLTDILQHNSVPAAVSATEVTHSTSTVSDDVMNTTPSTSSDVRTFTTTTSTTVSDDVMNTSPSASSDVRTFMTITSTVSDDVMNFTTSTSDDVRTSLTSTTATTTTTTTPQGARSCRHTPEVPSVPVTAAESAAASTDKSPDDGAECTAADSDQTCCPVSGSEQKTFTAREKEREGTGVCQSCCSGMVLGAEGGGGSEVLLSSSSLSTAVVLAEPERKKPCHRCPVCLHPFPSRSLCNTHIANCRPSPDDSCTSLISPAAEDVSQRLQGKQSRQPASSLRLVSNSTFRRNNKLRKRLTGVHTMKSPCHKQYYNTFPFRRNAGNTSMQGKDSVISVAENCGNALRKKNLQTARMRNQRSKHHQLRHALSKPYRQQTSNAKGSSRVKSIQKLHCRNKNTGSRKQKTVRGILNIATKPMFKTSQSYSDRFARNASPLSAQQLTKCVNSASLSSNSLLPETNVKEQPQEKSPENPDLCRTPLLECGVLNKPYLSTSEENSASGQEKDKGGYTPEAPSIHSSISLQYSCSARWDSDTSHTRYTLSNHMENRFTTNTEHTDGRRDTNDGRHTDITDKPGDASNVRASDSGDSTDSDHRDCRNVNTINIKHDSLTDLRHTGDRETQLTAKEQELLQKELKLQQREMTLNRQSQLVQQLVREWHSSLQSDSDQPVNSPREDNTFSPQQVMVEFLTLMKAMGRKKNGQTVATVKRIAPKPSSTTHQQSIPPSRAGTEQLTEAAKTGYTGTLSGTRDHKTEVQSKKFDHENLPVDVKNGPVSSREPLAYPPALAPAALCTSAVSLSDLASNDSLKRRCSLSFSACTPPSPAPCASCSSTQKEEARTSSSSSLTGKQGGFLEEVMRLAPRLPKSAREFLPNQPRNLPSVMPCYGSTPATVASKAVPPMSKLPQRWIAATKGNGGTNGTGGTGQSRFLSLSGGEMKETPSFIQEKLLSPLVRVSPEEMERLLALGSKTNTPCVTLDKSELRASALLCNLSSSCGHPADERNIYTSHVAKNTTPLTLLPTFVSHDMVSKTSPPTCQHSLVGTPNLTPLPPLLPTSASDCDTPITPTSASSPTPPHCSPSFHASNLSENTGPLDLTMKTSSRASGCSPVSNGLERRRSETEQGSGEMQSLLRNQTIENRNVLSSKAQPPSTCSQVSDTLLRPEHHVDAYPSPSNAVSGNKNHKRRSKDKKHRHHFSHTNTAKKPSHVAGVSLHNNESCQPKTVQHILYANTYTPSVVANTQADKHNSHRADRMTHHSILLNGSALPREHHIPGCYENPSLQGVLAPGVFLMPVSEAGSAWSVHSGKVVTETASSLCAPEKAVVSSATSLTKSQRPTSSPTPINLSPSSSSFISSSPSVRSPQPAHTSHMSPTMPRFLWTGIPVASISAPSQRGPPILPVPSASLTRPPVPPVLTAAPASPAFNPPCNTSMSSSGPLLLSPSGLIPAPIQLMPSNDVTTQGQGPVRVIHQTYTPGPFSMEQKNVYPLPVFHSLGSGMVSSSTTHRGEKQEKTVVEGQLSRKDGGGHMDQRKSRTFHFEREEGNDEMERKGRQFHFETGEGNHGLERKGRQFHFETGKGNDGLERKGRNIQPERKEVGGEVRTWLQQQTQMQEQMLKVLRKKRQQQQQERRKRNRLSCDSGGLAESK